MRKYEGEAEAIQRQLKAAEPPLSPEPALSYDQLDALAREFTDLKTLTPELLFKLVEKIEVSQGSYQQTEKGQVKVQSVKIYFRFLTQARKYQYTA